MKFLVLAAFAAVSVSGAADRIVRAAPVGSPWDPALLDPEGRSRWDLSSAVLGPAFERRSSVRDGAVEIEASGQRTVWRDAAGGDAAVRYLFPDRDADALRPGTRHRFDLEVDRDGGSERLRVEVETVGIGWLDLPSGPREVVLQWVLVQGGAQDRIVHRWVDPRAGIVAEAEGLAAQDGRARLGVSRAEAVVEIVAGAADLKIYVDQFPEIADATTPYGNVLYGWNRGVGSTVSQLTPEAYANAGALIDASTWNFSGNTSGTEVATTYVNVTSAQTCNYAQCGYNLPNVRLGRRDVGFGTAGLERSNQVVERENRPTDVTVWLRAGSQKEGKSGIFGEGESRLCYVSVGSDTRSPVPLWRFANQDTAGWFMDPGDTWQSSPFNCEQNIFNQRCGEPQFLDKLYAKACGDHTGTQFGGVLKGGVVVLPSGHTFNALLARTVADFCVYSAAGCNAFFKADEVRTIVYIWQVPHLGTVALIQGPQNGPADLRSFSSLDYTDFRTGLLPPVSITVTGRTDTSVSLSWNPGNDTRRIVGYRVYWDTDSGASSGYAFDSQSHPGQVSFSGTSATITGLTPGTRYYLTVTSLSDFTNPSTNLTERFESLKYPTQVSGDPSFVYPVEVQDVTTGGTCVPTAEVQNLRAGKPSGQFELCWDATTDPCAVGYDVVGASVPQGPFGTVAQVGAVTCWSGNPSQKYFRVRARGTGGTGP